MNLLNADSQSWVLASVSWQMQGHPDKAADRISHLDREQTLAAWEAINAVQAALTRHDVDLIDAVHVHHYNGAGLCECEAVAVPAYVDGFPIGIRT
jgi:hypothetical protein